MNTTLQQYEHFVSMMGELSFHLPEIMESFDEMRMATVIKSELDKKSKNLIGLGLAIANGGEGWIEYFVISALQTGATQHEVFEIIGVALLMGGAAITKYACLAYETMNAYELRDRDYRREAMQETVAVNLQHTLPETVLVAAR